MDSLSKRKKTWNLSYFECNILPSCTCNGQLNTIMHILQQRASTVYICPSITPMLSWALKSYPDRWRYTCDALGSSVNRSVWGSTVNSKIRRSLQSDRVPRELGIGVEWRDTGTWIPSEATDAAIFCNLSSVTHTLYVRMRRVGSITKQWYLITRESSNVILRCVVNR